MSRSGYSDELDNWELIKWRGQVASAIRGKRGQRLLRDLLDALDAMPTKRLIAHDLETEEGEVCALGAAVKARGLDPVDLDPDDWSQVAEALNIAEPLEREIAYRNDEFPLRPETPEQRWRRMRDWVESQIQREGREAVSDP